MESLHWPITPQQKLAVALIIIWTLIWKGIAMWKAARSGSKAWYVVLMVVNTVGILEMLYIFWISKRTAYS
jgi:hypothetical protein